MSAPQLHPALSRSDSVQIIYRPVLQGKIPDIPDPDDLNYIQNKIWWKEQTKRCTEGWIAPNGVFINPIYYFYLNFVKVYVIDELNKKTPGWQNPYVRDGDKEYFDAVYYGMAYESQGISYDAKNVIVAKGRRKGWTTAELYGITLWFFLFKQGFNISRAYPNDKIKKKERRLFTKCYDMIHPFFKYNVNDQAIDILENNEDTVAQWTYSYSSSGKQEKNELVNSISFFTVGADGGGVRGDALCLIVVVEAGIYTHLESFFAAAEETLQLGSYKFGQILVGGTSDAINNLTTDYKKMFFNPQQYNAVSVFTPAWKCFMGAIDYVTGKSLKSVALPKILENRHKREGNGDYEGLRKLIQEHPISPEEAFIPSSHSEYDSIKIDRQLMSILRTGMDSEWIRGKLEWELDTYGNRTGKVLFNKDSSGFWLILENFGVPLEIENLYVAGIDDVYKDKAPHSESKNCMVIYMRDSIHAEAEMADLPVCFYLGRHGNRMLDYAEFHKATLFYNCWNMYEHNDSAGFIGYAREHGISKNFIYHNGQIGIRLSDDTIADMTLLGLKYFEEDRHLRIFHSSVIECFKYWNSGINSDLASAFHLVLFGLNKLKKKGTWSEADERLNKGKPKQPTPINFFERTNVNSTIQFGKPSTNLIVSWN